MTRKPPQTHANSRTRSLKQAGIHIIAVGVGSMLTTTDLAAVASLPSSRNAIYALRFANLPAQVEKIAAAMCG